MIAVLCAKFQKDLSTEMGVLGKYGFTRFQLVMNFQVIVFIVASFRVLLLSTLGLWPPLGANVVQVGLAHLQLLLTLGDFFQNKKCLKQLHKLALWDTKVK